jgi:hypothetical protein
VFTEPLPSNDTRDPHTDTQTGGEGLINMPLRMGSGDTTYIPSFMKTGSGIETLIQRVS